MKNFFKATVKGLLAKRVWPVLFGPLQGIRLRYTNLVKVRNYLQPYEPERQSAFDFLLKSGNVFFDIGANVGLHSYYVARKFPNTRVIAFEPLPENAKYIRETIQINKFENIEVVELAASNTSGYAFFDKNDNNSTGMLVQITTSLKVKTITLDDYILRTGQFPDVVKIDVEGAEGNVLEGSIIMMKDKCPTFVIELHNPEQDLKVAKLLIDHNYQIFRLRETDIGKERGLFIPVGNTHASWPDPEGVWGSIVAIHKSRSISLGV